MFAASRWFTVIIILVLTLASLFPSPASAQPRNWPRPAETPEEKAAAIERKLMTSIETAPFQKEMSFVEFLALLEKQLPAESKLAFRIHKEAFGKEHDKLAKTSIVFERFPRRLTVATALRLALSKTDLDEPPEFYSLPTHVSITTLEHTIQTAVYDVADLVKESRFLLSEIKHLGIRFGLREYPTTGSLVIPIGPDFSSKGGAAWLEQLTPKDGANWIVRLIMHELDPDFWSPTKAAPSIQVLNETRLKVHGAARWHKSIREMLVSLRRLADIAVVMNAKLIEVDRAFFDGQIAPLLIDAKDKSKASYAVPISPELWKQLQRERVIQQTDDIKIKPRQVAKFLSRQTAYRYRANAGDPEKDPTTVYRIGVEGVTFQVQAEISNDRRCMRLKLTQETVQLVKITKGKKVDLESGKEYEIDLPNVKTGSSATTIELHEGESFVMPVHYRLSLVKDKTWLLVAEPIIWIEEEQEQIRLGNLPLPEPGNAQEKPVKEKPLPEPPKTEDVKEILQALVTDVLTNQEQGWKKLRESRTTPGNSLFTLLDGGMAWPKWFQPNVPGFKLYPQPGNCPNFEPGRLTIRLDVFDLNKKLKDPPPFGERPIQISIHSVGGSGPRFIRGMRVGYDVKREGKRWVVQWVSMESP